MMKIGISKQDLELLLSQATFHTHGDNLEQQYGGFLSEHFPRCEEFWNVFVVPLTKRIENSAGRLGTDIHFRNDMDVQLTYIACAHYSMFVHLAYAHQHYSLLHSDNPLPSSLEDIYTHLVSTCDLAETFIEKWYLVRLICQGKVSEFSKPLSRRKFQKQMGIWYDKRYAKEYENYLSKGKKVNVPIPASENLIQEYFGELECRKEYARFSLALRTFRNVAVHNVKVGTLVAKDGKKFIPKISTISDYKTWDSIEKIKDDEEKIKQDFEEMNAHILGSIQGLEARLNDLWEKIILDFKDEFSSPERNKLRDMFAIALSDAPRVITATLMQRSVLEPIPYNPESGFIRRPDPYGFNNPAGSAIYPINPERVKGSDENKPQHFVPGSGLIYQKDDTDD
jgi:hypothetical protein